MNRRTGAIAAIPIAICAAALTAPVAAASRADADLGLEQQVFNIPAGAPISITVRVADDLAAQLAFGAARVDVDAYPVVRTIADVSAATDGDLDPDDQVDTIVVPRTTTDGQPTISFADDDLGLVTIAIPTQADDTDDSGADETSALQLDEPGVYPIRVSISTSDPATGEPLVDDDGNALSRASLTTFIHRLADDDEAQPGALNVAVAMHPSLNDTITVDPATGAVTIDDTAIATLTDLAAALEASEVPATVTIDTAVLVALAERDPALATRLFDALRLHRLAATPQLPLDPAISADAGAASLYTEWLRAGEDIAADTIDGTSQRAATTLIQPLNTAGATLMRNLGTRLLIVGSDYYDGLDGSLAGFTDTTQLLGYPLDDGSTLPLIVADRRFANLLSTPTDAPVSAAIEGVAMLLAAREEIADSGGQPDRRTIVLATDDLRSPDPTRLQAITGLLAETPGLQAISGDDIVSRTRTLIFEGGELVVNAPTVDGSGLRGRIERIDGVRAEATATASMFTDTNTQLAEWNSVLDRLETTALDDTVVDGRLDQLRDQLAGWRDAVQLPQPFSFTITGTRNSIPLRFTNTAEIPLRIKVRVISPKLEIEDQDQIVELPPGGSTTVEVAVRARSNGGSPVSLDVFTPTGDLRLSQRVPLEAQVRSLRGIGPLVTGVALLLLVVWWGRHVLNTRREAALTGAAGRHPVGGDRTEPDTQTSTTASTLPDS